jgi:hypothetical protein
VRTAQTLGYAGFADLRRELIDGSPAPSLENPAARPDGSWLVTIPSHNRVDLVHPDGSHEVFARLPKHVTGIVAEGYGACVLVGSMRQHDWQLVHVDDSGAETICDWVYASNTGQALLLRCRYDVAAPASQLETVAHRPTRPWRAAGDDDWRHARPEEPRAANRPVWCACGLITHPTERSSNRTTTP